MGDYIEIGLCNSNYANLEKLQKIVKTAGVILIFFFAQWMTRA